MPYADSVAKREYMRAYHRKWRAENPDKDKAKQLRHYAARRPDLKRRYGISKLEMDAMVIAQDGKCAVCEQPLKRVYVDHDHCTGKVRGIVCCRCNIRLSAVDDSEWLAKAHAYKAKFSCH